jgi:hypothetical protein
MKKIKMKDTILSHYQKVHELEMDGITVRVWKPRTMQQLPAYHMREFVCNRAEDYKRYMDYEDQSVWHAGNPDWGMWDAQTVYHCDPSHKTLDIYIAAILVRPFSREAYETYCRMHEAINEVNQRLMLMWDSREFDRINGYDTSYGAYQNQEEVDSWMYRAVNKDNDIADHSPSCYLQVIDEGDEESPVRRCGMTLRQTPGGTEFNATNNGEQPFEDYCETPLIQDFAKLYTKFREQYPEVTEMRFYTDELVRTEEEGE